MVIFDRRHQYGVALLRILVGVIFLWAGLEKAVGSGELHTQVPSGMA